MGIISYMERLLEWLLSGRRRAKIVAREKDDDKYLDYLSKCSAKEATSGLLPESFDSSIEPSLERVESVLLPLVSCIDVIQKRNPQLKDFPDLITPSVDNLIVPKITFGMVYDRKRRNGISELGTILGSLIDYDHPVWRDNSSWEDMTDRMEDWSEYEDRDYSDWEEDDDLQGFTACCGTDEDVEGIRKEATKTLDTESFDLYCKCRQFIDAAGGYLTPGEKEVVQRIIARSEGDGFRKKYDSLLKPQMKNKAKDSDIRTLILPSDFFENSSYFDPDAFVIGCLSDTILRGGSQRFALMIDTLASRSFGYIQPNLGNKKLLVSRLTGRSLPTTYSEIQWNEIKPRSVSETEKVMLWMTNFMFGGGYDRAYEILNLKRTIKPGQETANLKNADKVFRSRVEGLYRKV